MPRFLWLGLVACAACLIAAIVFVLGDEPLGAAEFVHEPAAGVSQSDAPVLADSEPAAPTPRAVIEVEREPTSTEPVRRGSGGYKVTSGSVHFEPPAPFEAGVIEVHVVRDEDGGPIAGAEVQLVSASGWNWENADDRIATTDASGTTTFTGVREGPAEITASVKGRAVGKATLRIHRDEPEVAAEVRLPVRREALVHLLDALGRPFRAQDLNLAHEHAALLGIALSGSCGSLGQRFESIGAPQFTARSTGLGDQTHSWRLEIRGGGPACVHAILGDTIVGVEPIPLDANEVAIRVDANALDSALKHVVVRVLDETNDAPIEGANVEFRGGVSNPLTLTTDAAGLVRTRLALSGEVPTFVRAAGRVSALVKISNPPPPEFVVRLGVGRKISGRVVDQDGGPLVGVRVQLRDKRASMGSPTTSTAADGTFALEGLAATEFVVLADKLNASGGAKTRGTAQADCRAGDATGVEITIPVEKR